MKNKLNLLTITLALTTAACQTDEPFKNIPAEGYVEVEGGRIWYRIAEKNRTGIPLLIVHGGPGAPHDYMLNLEVISQERPVIFYDQLGCGNSEKPSDTALWQADRFVRELHALTEALKLEKFHLLGQSWGGFLALNYLQTYGDEKVSSLILSAPLIRTQDWVADQQQWIDQLPDGLQDTIRKYEALGNYEAAAYQEAMGVFYSRHLCRLNPWPELLTAAFGKMNLEQYNHMWGPSEFTATGNLMSADLTAQLGQISVPCLITCGEFDEATPQRMEQYLLLLKNGQLKVFEDASHIHHLEAETEYLTTLRDFMQTP